MNREQEIRKDAAYAAFAVVINLLLAQSKRETGDRAQAMLDVAGAIGNQGHLCAELIALNDTANQARGGMRMQ